MHLRRFRELSQPRSLSYAADDLVALKADIEGMPVNEGTGTEAEEEAALTALMRTAARQARAAPDTPAGAAKAGGPLLSSGPAHASCAVAVAQIPAASCTRPAVWRARL